MRRSLIVLALLAASVVSPPTWAASPAFSSAHSVEAFRVAPPYEKRKTSGKIFHGQKIIAGPRRVSPASTRATTEELQRVYRVDFPPLYCAFVPRYGLRLRLPTHAVEVLVCPHCGEVQFYTGDHVRRASISPALLQLLEMTFPDYPLRSNET